MGTAPNTPSACTKCGIHPRRVNQAGRLDELCEACQNARLEEINRISDYYEKHPDECCCHTFFGRGSCKSPVHGDWWTVNGIENGKRFCFFIRAKDRREAMEVGKEACADNGEECVGVRKVGELGFCLQCQKLLETRYWTLPRLRGHFCSEVCCDKYKETHELPNPSPVTCW